jgi:hypothetical protein
MILSKDESLIISTLGWVDKGGLWLFDTKRGSIFEENISEAAYLSLHPGLNGFFAIVHHFSHFYDADRVSITAHSEAEPGKVLSRVLPGTLECKIEGDCSVWHNLPTVYVAFFKTSSLTDYHLFLVDPAGPSIEIVSLDWYDDTYDKGYEGVTDVVRVPNHNQAVISIHRDSHPILYDLDTRMVVRELSLADRHGGPKLRFRQRAEELWATDYDTLLRLSSADWTVMNSALLQGGGPSVSGQFMSRQFIGDCCFNSVRCDPVCGGAAI